MFGGGIVGLVVLVLWAYCIVDVIGTDRSRIHNLPKTAWLFVVILVPPIGSIAWLLLGRRPAAALRSGPPLVRREAAAEPPVPERPVIADDHSAKREQALRRYQAEREKKLHEQEQELRRREEELRRREQGTDGTTG